MQHNSVYSAAGSQAPTAHPGVHVSAPGRLTHSRETQAMKWVTRPGVRECMQGIHGRTETLLTQHLLTPAPSPSLSPSRSFSSHRPVLLLFMLKINSGLERKADELLSADGCVGQAKREEIRLWSMLTLTQGGQARTAVSRHKVRRQRVKQKNLTDQLIGTRLQSTPTLTTHTHTQRHTPRAKLT